MAPAKEPGQAYAEFIKGLWKENPIFVAVLGMCPMLAVTNSAVNALAMASATFFVLLGSSVLIASLRKVIPNQVRISTFIIIIATFVTVADFSLEALVPDVHKELGAFIALIVVNCIILGRQEAFASKNSVRLAAMDAMGMGLGFALALFMLGSIREVLGAGTFFGISLFGPHYEPWVVMILPPGGFIMLGLLLLVFEAVKQARRRSAAGAERKAA
jgi:electron transport complex protein RnfE